MEFEEEMRKLDVEKDRIKTQSGAKVAELSAVQQGLVEALNALVDSNQAKAIMQAMPVEIVKNMTLPEVLKSVLGDKMAMQFENFTGQGNGA